MPSIHLNAVSADPSKYCSTHGSPLWLDVISVPNFRGNTIIHERRSAAPLTALVVDHNCQNYCFDVGLLIFQGLRNDFPIMLLGQDRHTKPRFIRLDCKLPEAKEWAGIINIRPLVPCGLQKGEAP
ncbi:unnamed protein product [Fusarium venenatum]|uniref:Uncharacterized protein n=1 Tax=Fusarium venenatum TaxID=56646 RepID=A0A2L2T7R1_9HYPO|nr:uncharacterized protein FVRRES_02301 [Fusarium venenatum]CEI65789.1 unnamed protein product [Fusarium venenatum]